MTLISVVTLAAFVVLVGWAFAELRSTPVNPTVALENAILIARQRVDRGEIDTDEFERVVSILRS